jgi:hypothetical protein
MVDIISAIVTLAVDGPAQKEAIKLLAPEYSQKTPEIVWAAWAPHLSLPPEHPLATGKLLRDAV